MKKIITAALAVLLCLSFVSCMNDVQDTTDIGTSDTQEKIVYPHEDMILASPGDTIANVGGIDIPVFALRYFFANTYSTFYSTNYEKIDSYFDPYVPLHDQVPKAEGYTDYATWYDYFLSEAKKELGYYLAFASAAKQNGLSLTDEEKAEVDSNIAQIEEEAKSYNMTFSEYMESFKMMGPDVTVDIMKETYYIFQLATKYSQQLYDGFEVGSDEIEKYFNEHKDLYTAVDYNILLITPEYDATSTEEETKKAKEKASAEADAFVEHINLGKTFSEAYRLVYPNLSEKEYEQFDESYLVERSEYYTQNYYGENVTTDVSKWLFAEGRSNGEITKLTDSQGRIKIVQVVKAPYKMEWQIPNIRYIYIDLSLEKYTASTAEALAKDIVEQIKNADDKDAAFKQLVEKHSDDTVTNKTGGLVENLLPSSLAFPQNMVSWCFEDGRQLYDCGYVDYTSYGVVCGYFITFISSYGEVYYEYMIDGTLRGEKLSDYAKKQLDELNVEYKSEYVDSIYK